MITRTYYYIVDLVLGCALIGCYKGAKTGAKAGYEIGAQMGRYAGRKVH